MTTIDVYHRPDRPRSWGRICRSWDGGMYLEVGVRGPLQSGFGPPPEGPARSFEIRNGRLSFGLPGSVVCHQPIKVDTEVENALRQCGA